MKLITASDPGINGGLCTIENGVIKELNAMPIITIELSDKKKRNFVNAIELKRIIDPFKNGLFYIEQVRSLYGMSAQSNFSMGQALGTINAVFQIVGEEFFMVRAVDWQKKVWIESDFVYLDGKRNTKATSLNAAKRIFPNESFLKSKRCSVPHDGLIDAALIAYSQF